MLRMRRIGGDRFPFDGVRCTVEARQHDDAVRQTRHRGDERRNRRHATGDAGGNDGISRRLLSPDLGLMLEHPIAPIGRIETADLGQRLGPMLGDDG